MRSFWTDLKRGLRHWVKPTLDTTRVERVYHHFDEPCHYREYLERCQAATPEEVPWEIARTVRERGFEHLRVMSVEQAAQLREMVVTRAHVAPLRKSAGMVNRLHLDDSGLEERLLNAVLPPSVAEKIRAFFGSEFFVYWFTVTRALPVREQTRNSFLWHCDRGPQAHLKLLIYLNGTREHGGNTEFTDLETTRRMAATGYIFGSMDDRLEDLGALARRAGIEFRPVAREIAAGEGILFQPARVLHRGLLPETTPRDVVTLCLLPSPVPWREAWAQGTGSDPETDDKWHDDALDLWRGLPPSAGEDASAVAAPHL
jgi:hypothetical protein